MSANIDRQRVSKLAKFAGWGVAAAVVVAAVSSYGSKPNEVGTFMRAKLDHSKKVLEGLALEDYAMIARESQEMSLLSQATNWQVLQTAEYLEQSQDFRRTADALTEAAREKNLDGAALRYVELTMQCVNCHKYVRKTRIAAIPDSADAIAGALAPPRSGDDIR